MEEAPIPAVVPIETETCSEHLEPEIPPKGVILFFFSFSVEIFVGTSTYCNDRKDFTKVFASIHILLRIGASLVDTLPESPPKWSKADNDSIYLEIWMISFLDDIPSIPVFVVAKVSGN